MPVTIRPASHSPRLWRASIARNASELLRGVCAADSNLCKSMIQSSFSHLDPAESSGQPRQNISPSQNGLVRAAESAYSGHHHLTIRPEDVWFAILSQLSFYINANAEALRHKFVSHGGKKELIIETPGTIHTVDFGELAICMTRKIDENLTDKDLRDWIMPNFSTTTSTDTVTAAVLMMGSMQKYFAYTMMLTCGIPSVTILGERSDWEEIRRRVDKLPGFGEESEWFATLLVPVLDYFLRSFDNPEHHAVLDFWNKIADRENLGSGMEYLSGWITAFCFWDVDGKVLHSRRRAGGMPASTAGEDKFDTSIYSAIDADDVPAGCVSVPVLIKDNGNDIKARMVAGSVGIAATSSGDRLDTESGLCYRAVPGCGPGHPDYEALMNTTIGLDTLQPVTGWWMYETHEDSD